MKCPKCDVENAQDATICTGCGAPLESSEKPVEKVAEHPKERKGGGKKVCKIAVPIVIVVVAGAAVLFFVVGSGGGGKNAPSWDELVGDGDDSSTGDITAVIDDSDDGQVDDQDSQVADQTGDQSGDQLETINLEDLPLYSDASVTDDFKLDGGGRRVSYDTTLGTTSKEIMDYYEQELTALGWKTVLRDVDDARLEMYGPDETFVRYWVYFEGINEPDSDPMPLTYILDFRPPGAEILPVPVQ